MLAASMKPSAVRIHDSFTSPAIRDIQDTFLLLSALHRTLPSTSCCTPETSPATNRWWKGKNTAASWPTDPPEEGEEEGVHEAEDNLSAADRG